MTTQLDTLFCELHESATKAQCHLSSNKAAYEAQCFALAEGWAILLKRGTKDHAEREEVVSFNRRVLSVYARTFTIEETSYFVALTWERTCSFAFPLVEMLRAVSRGKYSQEVFDCSVLLYKAIGQACLKRNTAAKLLPPSISLPTENDHPDIPGRPTNVSYLRVL